MPEQLLFVNIPVASVAKSRTFFGDALGWEFDDRFSDETTACMKVNEGAYFMLLEHERFDGFAPSGTHADLSTGDAQLLTFSVESREAVDATLEKVIAAGGTETNKAEDHGFMYSRAFYDLDGQGWSAMWMDPAVAAGEAPVEHSD